MRYHCGVVMRTKSSSFVHHLWWRSQRNCCSTLHLRWKSGV